MTSEKMTGLRKVAIFLVAMGNDLAEVLKYFDEEQVEELFMEISKLGTITAEEKQQVINEFEKMIADEEHAPISGGVNYAKEILFKAFGQEKASSIIKNLTQLVHEMPFEFLRHSDPTRLYTFIANEHPQTQAVVMAHLTPEQAAEIIKRLPSKNKIDIIRRIAKMERTSPEIISELENSLLERFEGLSIKELVAPSGIQTLVNILKNSDKGTEKTILEELEKSNPELAQEIRKRMLVFEDIIMIDDRILQNVLRKIDMMDLAKALLTASEDVKEKIFRNVSKNYRKRLLEEMEYLGPVHRRKVEEAQERIVDYLRELQEEGALIVPQNTEDDVVVQA